MKPFIYQIKGTECYISVSEYKDLWITSNKNKASVYRTKQNVVRQAFTYTKDNHHFIGVQRKDTDIIHMLDAAKYKKIEFSSVAVEYKLFYDSLIMVDVEDKPMVDTSITGNYVIKLKGLDLYLRPTSDRMTMLTTDKSEAAVFNKPKIDIITKMSRGINPDGSVGSLGGTPTKEIKLWTDSKRGKKVSDYIINSDTAKKFFEDLPSRFETYDNLYDEIEYDIKRSWCVHMYLPVECWEREAL